MEDTSMATTPPEIAGEINSTTEEAAKETAFKAPEIPVVAVPEKVRNFQISVKGFSSGSLFKGEFQYTQPNWKTLRSISIREAELNTVYKEQLDDEWKTIHKMIARLEYTITKAPGTWWNFLLTLEHNDGNVLQEVYSKVNEFQTEWENFFTNREDVKGI